jgi:hypothetical protein
MFDPSFHIDQTGLMVYDHYVRRDIRNSKHEIISGVPRCQVIPVSDIAINIDVFFAAVAVEEHHGDFHAGYGASGQFEIKVVQRPVNKSLIDNRTSLDGLEGRDEVWEVGST